VPCSWARAPPSPRAIRWQRSGRVAIPRSRCRTSISASVWRPTSRDTSIRSGSCPCDPPSLPLHRRRRRRSHRPSLRPRTSPCRVPPRPPPAHLPPRPTRPRSSRHRRRQRLRRLPPHPSPSLARRRPDLPARWSCRRGRGAHRQQRRSPWFTRRGRRNRTAVTRRPRAPRRRSGLPRRSRPRSMHRPSGPPVAPVRCLERTRPRSRLHGSRATGSPRRSRPAAVSLAGTARGSPGPAVPRRSRRTHAVRRPACCGPGGCP
jgi:hypothetical protein